MGGQILSVLFGRREQVAVCRLLVLWLRWDLDDVSVSGRRFRQRVGDLSEAP